MKNQIAMLFIILAGILGSASYCTHNVYIYAQYKKEALYYFSIMGSDVSADITVTPRKITFLPKGHVTYAEVGAGLGHIVLPMFYIVPLQVSGHNREDVASAINSAFRSIDSMVKSRDSKLNDLTRPLGLRSDNPVVLIINEEGKLEKAQYRPEVIDQLKKRADAAGPLKPVPAEDIVSW